MCKSQKKKIALTRNLKQETWKLEVKIHNDIAIPQPLEHKTTKHLYERQGKNTQVIGTDEI